MRATLDQFTAGSRRELVERLVGRKVTVATRDFHYAVGQLVALGSDERLHLRVGASDVFIDRSALVSIREADEAVAEYVK